MDAQTAKRIIEKNVHYDEVKRLLGNHPGSSPVFIHLEDGRQTTVLRLGPEWCVDPRGGLHGELRVLLGADAVF